MKIAFRALPGENTTVPRPIVNVYVDGISSVAMACLLDTGSLHNRFAGWIAQEAGIETGGVAAESIGVGGRSTIARTVTVRLGLGDFWWETPVSFCDPWPWDFNLLGQEGFLRWFTVTIKAAARTLEIKPL
ncbi:MAG: hypothetical protein ABR548_11115 [Actinomycetota bacterium]|nr:retropepsin-like domain-containing protein [Actinomycetota bacterium]